MRKTQKGKQGKEEKETEGAAGGGGGNIYKQGEERGLRKKRSLPEEEGAQVWFLFSWTSLLSYHFVMISGFASFFFFPFIYPDV